MKETLDVNVDIDSFLKDLDLSDNDIKPSFQLINNKLVFYFTSKNWTPNDFFNIDDIKYELLSLINYLKTFNFNLISMKYRDNNKKWVSINNLDINISIDSFELVLEK